MQTWGDIRMCLTSMQLFDSMCIQDCSLILFVQVEPKKCFFRSRSQFTIACHNPGNLRNRRMIISVARCIKGLPAMSVSFRINVSNMLEIRVLSASACRRGLRLRIWHCSYRLHVTAERQCELRRCAHRAARILKRLKFETIQDFAILWCVRHILEDMTPMSALFIHWRGMVSCLWRKKSAKRAQIEFKRHRLLRWVWRSGQVVNCAVNQNEHGKSSVGTVE